MARVCTLCFSDVAATTLIECTSACYATMKRIESDAEPPRDATLVVVLGMHRSGTSVMTRAMETMGAEFGDNLMPAVVGVNDKGFFEDLDIYAINVEILALAGAEWHSVAPIELDNIDGGVLQRIRGKAVEVLTRKCEGRTFALKDPRIARLLPFWKSVFADLAARVVYVVAVRNPKSVSGSLERRDQFPTEKSLLLWLIHTVAALEGTRGLPRAIVDYDRLMERAHEELARVSSCLQLPLDTRRVTEFEDEFLDGRLRHNRFVIDDLAVASLTERHAKTLFGKLVSAHLFDADRFEQEVEPVIVAARGYLDGIAPILDLESQLERTISHLQREIAANRETISTQQRDIEIQASSIGDWQARAQSASAVAESLRAESQVLKSELESLASAIRSRDEALAGMSVQRAALERAENTIDQMLQSTSWRITGPLRMIRKYALPRK